VSEFNPADVATTVGRLAPESLSDVREPFADDDADAVDASDADFQPKEREGLPSSYRMRAEDHYVDELTRRGNIERTTAGGGDGPHGAEAAALSVREHDALVLERLADEIDAIDSAAALLTERTGPLPRQVAADLVRAQARRAAWLLQARPLVIHAGEPHTRSTAIGTMLGRVRDSLTAECRLAGVTLQVQTSDWQAPVNVDPETIVTGVTGAVLATLGLLGPSHGAAVRVTAVTLGGELRTVEVHQEAVTVPAMARRHLFDPAWTDRPGGVLASLGALVSRAVSRQHGGDAVFMVRERRGSTLRLTFSRRT